MKTQQRSQSGFSLVEALVAIAVLLITLVGPMTIAAQGVKSSQFSLEQNTAFFLAQEGIEAIFAIRNNYALMDVDDGLDAAVGDPDTSRDWIVTELNGTGPCSLSAVGDTCSFGIDFKDVSPTHPVSQNFTSSLCNGTNPPACRLYTKAANAPAVYSHDSSGDESPFTRVVTVEVDAAGAGSGDSIKVTSTVTWDSHVFGGDERKVVLTTYLYDSNYEI